MPKEFSTGGKQRLLGISKRGNPYLRKLLVHGARSCVLHLDRARDHQAHGSVGWKPEAYIATRSSLPSQTSSPESRGPC
ncbi:transposase [Trinickia acidisoli]|uniref:transposase n=1 Tax=Trinickia acidisoli TaxID=2767482 RepID=UPI001A8E3B92